MRQLIPSLVAGLLLAACSGDSNAPQDQAADKPRVIGSQVTCDGCRTVEITVGGPGLDGVVDAFLLPRSGPQIPVSSSAEIRHFVGDSGRVLQIRVTLNGGAPAGEYDLRLETASPGGGSALMIARAVKLISASPGGDPPPRPPGPTAVVRVRASLTSGVASAQFLVTVDPCDTYSCPGLNLASGSPASFTLPPGRYTFALTNLGSCTVAEPRTVTLAITEGQFIDIAFTVTCPPPPPPPLPGTVRVTAAVTGPDADLDYGVRVVGCFDYYSLYACEQQLPAGGGVEFSLAPGPQAIELFGVAGNCTVTDSNPRAVTVASGATTEVAFAVTCVPAARLRVTVSTTGPDAPASYTATVADAPCPFSRSCYRFNGTVSGSTEWTLRSGTYSVTLLDVPANCALGGSNPQSATLAAGVTTEVIFTVTCTALPPPPPPGMVRISAPTSGTNLDLGYRVVNESLCNWYYYSCVEQSLRWDTVVENTLMAGTYSFRLIDVASNCTVLVPNPATVVVTSGMTTELVFRVTCN